MLINRKSRKLTRKDMDQMHTDSIDLSSYHGKQVEITSYPSLEYILAVLLIAISIYLLYSANGGRNGINGFKQRQWWQFVVALVPMLLGLGFIVACQIQTVSFCRRQNWIISTKTRCFCYITENMKKQFSDLVGLSVVKSGTEQANITMVEYHIVLSFKTMDELVVLRCMSEAKILSYFQEMRRIFDQSQISQKKVVIQNLLL